LQAVTETQQATKTTWLNLGEIGLFCAPSEPSGNVDAQRTMGIVSNLACRMDQGIPK
jgi:hypothetical protein